MLHEWAKTKVLRDHVRDKTCLEAATRVIRDWNIDTAKRKFEHTKEFLSTHFRQTSYERFRHSICNNQISRHGNCLRIFEEGKKNTSFLLVVSGPRVVSSQNVRVQVCSTSLSL